MTINGWRPKGGILLYGTFLPIITQLSFLWRKEREGVGVDGVDQRSFSGRAFLPARQLTEREEGSEDRPREGGGREWNVRRRDSTTRSEESGETGSFSAAAPVDQWSGLKLLLLHFNSQHEPAPNNNNNN